MHVVTLLLNYLSSRGPCPDSWGSDPCPCPGPWGSGPCPCSGPWGQVLVLVLILGGQVLANIPVTNWITYRPIHDQYCRAYA